MLLAKKKDSGHVAPISINKFLFLAQFTFSSYGQTRTVLLTYGYGSEYGSFLWLGLQIKDLRKELQEHTNLFIGK